MYKQLGEKLKNQDNALKEKERYLSQKEQFLNQKENELLLRERELHNIKESLVGKQDENRAEKDKLIVFKNELQEKERLINELIIRQKSLSTTSTSNAYTDEFVNALRAINKKVNENRQSHDTVGSCGATRSRETAEGCSGSFSN